MAFIMTATLAMHDIMAHSLNDTKWVIQSHIMAMFLPSLITGELIRNWGTRVVLTLGLLAYFIAAAVAYTGVEVVHYWWALVLLGVGWNFLFIGGTTLLPQSYSDHEKHQAQALNDVMVFIFQALASISAGVILFLLGWQAIITLSIVPTILLMALLMLFWRKVH